MGLELYFKKLLNSFILEKHIESIRVVKWSHRNQSEDYRVTYRVCVGARGAVQLVYIETAVGEIDRTGRDVNQL